jgi:hypothetical protein
MGGNMAEIRILKTADGLVFAERGDFNPVPTLRRVLRQPVMATTIRELEAAATNNVAQYREYFLSAQLIDVLIYDEYFLSAQLIDVLIYDERI